MKLDQFNEAVHAHLKEHKADYGKDYELNFTRALTQDNKTTITPVDFVTLCRRAGKQTSEHFPAVDGCTKTLAVLLEAVKANFDQLDNEVKTELGLVGKKANDITHFDLLEIGLYGKVQSQFLTAEMLARHNADEVVPLVAPPANVFLRNENLKEIYSAKYAPPGNGPRDSSLPERINNASTNPQSSQFKHENLYVKRCEIRVTQIGGNNPDTLPYAIYGSKATNTDANKIFIEKITGALDNYNSQKTGVEGFMRRMFGGTTSDGSAKLSSDLGKILKNETITPEEKVNAVTKLLSETDMNKIGDAFAKTLMKAGFIDQNRQLTMPKVAEASPAKELTL